LPTYALYGESGRSFGVDWLHCESIAERSRLHEWKIRPHRHDVLFQILYVRRGKAVVLADGARKPLSGPCIVTIPALAAHGFSFAPTIDGVVVTVVERHLQRLLSQEPRLASAVLRFRAEQLAAGGARALDEAATALQCEHAASGPWRALALDAKLLNLIVEVGRHQDAHDAAASLPTASRSVGHVQRFRDVVERRYHERPSLQECAQELGITSTQLNRVCRQVLGQSALDVMHARTVLEAQRELAYTNLSIKQIGLGLGFAEPGYFTRFFLRECGLTPTQWRAAASR